MPTKKPDIDDKSELITTNGNDSSSNILKGEESSDSTNLSDAKNATTIKEGASSSGNGYVSSMPDLKKVIPGDTITFGRYPQDFEGTIEPIEWIVLDKQDDKVLIISKFGLDAKPYNDVWTDVTWETCSLRSWLNKDFIKKAFSTEEQKIILDTVVVNDDNPIYSKEDNYDVHIEGGNDTIDKAFCYHWMRL